jgi:hypothetical protein
MSDPAAIPDRDAATLPSAADVIAGTTMPSPRPAADSPATSRPRSEPATTMTAQQDQADDEDQPVERDVDREPGGHAHREGTLAEQSQGEHGPSAASFGNDEENATHDGERDRGQHRRRCPAERAGLDGGAGQRRDRDDRERLAGRVERAVRPGRLGRVAEGQPEADRAERQVDEEDRPPADGGDEQPARQRPGGQRG